MIIPKFSNEKEEAAWWDAHRSEIETEICAGMKQQMATEADGLEWLIATEINERAGKMTSEDRARADSETKKIAAQVQNRNP